jgi:hypothetical protein
MDRLGYMMTERHSDQVIEPAAQKRSLSALAIGNHAQPLFDEYRRHLSVVGIDARQIPSCNCSRRPEFLSATVYGSGMHKLHATPQLGMRSLERIRNCAAFSTK